MSWLSMEQLTASPAGLGDLREDGTRCLPCHFKEEEQHMHRFPPALRRRLLAEHVAIERSFRSGRVPHALLEAHADLEDQAFPRYLPPALVASFLADHASYRRKTPHWGCEQ